MEVKKIDTKYLRGVEVFLPFDELVKELEPYEQDRWAKQT